MGKIEYLTKEDIFDSNKATIEVHGGTFVPPDNLKNEATLDYLLETVEHGVIYGEPMYPSLVSKAALYVRKIAQGHVFNDGNNELL